MKPKNLDNRPRPRGAQPGNTNALKHGFYAKHFNQLELSDLETALSGGLDNEIEMLRVAQRRTFAEWKSCVWLCELRK